MSFRRPAILWYIVIAPFLTLGMLAAGNFYGMWVLFFSHMALTFGTVIPTWQFFGPVITRFASPRKEIWLTIDDGPDPLMTPQILRLLKAFEAKATFFLIGEKVSQHPNLVRQMLAEGHSIGNHTWTHPMFAFWRLGPKSIRREIDEFERVMWEEGLPCPLLFRSPTGMKNPFVHPILDSRRLVLVGWSGRAYDTRLADPSAIVQRLIRRAKPGAIFLIHDGQTVTASALESLLVALTDRDYRCVIPRLNQLTTGRFLFRATRV